MFLTDILPSSRARSPLVPQVVDAVKVPVIAAGGIADGAASRRRSALVRPACRSVTAYFAVRSPR